MNNEIPSFLYDLLSKQYSKNEIEKIIKGYSSRRYTTLRINTLKTNVESVLKVLKDNGCTYKKVEWSETALILENVDELRIKELDIYKNGEIYLQSLSSMLPAIILNPKPEENILDMAAAPGSKTTQIAMLTDNKALITACEKNKIRAERLKYNIEKQEAKRINILTQDARSLSEYFIFDKILLDSPCSGSGTINLLDKNLEKIFTKELVERIEKTQLELLKKAISILKPGHEMIYSTCSILKNENEENIQKVLKSGNIEIVPIDEKYFKILPVLSSNLEGTITICPTELYEGFFVAKLRKK